VARPFPIIRGEPADRYDAVVIGAGIGGLTCAALLARAGLRVLLVEQHYMVGGYCSTFRRNGYTFDAATHFYPLLGNPATVTGHLLRDLGISTSWIKMDPVDSFHFPDGTSFDVPADFETYRLRVGAAFPAEAASLDEFFALVRSAYLAGLLHHFRWRETPRFSELRALTVRDVLDRYFRDPRLKLLLTADCPHWGSPPCRTSFVFDSMLRLSYFLGNYYPKGGSQAFADALATRVTALSGDILMGSRVLRIAVRDGAARGVELLAGPVRARRRLFVRAPIVVSNADLLQTLEYMIEPRIVGSDLLTRLRRFQPSYPCFLMHLGLRGVPTELLRARQGYYWDGWNSDRVGTDALRFKLFVPTLYEPAMAPPGDHVLIVQKVQAIDYRSITDWRAHKRAVEEFILTGLERLIPGITKHMVVRLSATASTHQRYTLNHEGAMLGWEMSPDQLGDSRLDVGGLIPGLYLVGHWARPGGGITPVMVSAMEVARRAIAGFQAGSAGNIEEIHAGSRFEMQGVAL
jgi:phytoene dehydrogenase-like protein